jgi:ribosomal protein L11 methyltransferase
MASSGKKDPDLWTHARIPAPEEAEDAIAALCLELGAPGVQTGARDFRRAAKGGRRAPRIRIEAWFPPAVSREKLEKALQNGLVRIRASFPGLNPKSLRVADFTVGDYGTSWRENFPPLKIGKTFLISPSWHKLPQSRRHTVVIDPGQAFGTGHHSTTRGCILALEEEFARTEVRRGLDVGTGSGVLAIAMRKLGAARVVAIDNDPLSLAVNNCAPLRVGANLSAARGEFDVVIANLYSRLLVRMAASLANRVKPGGSLIVSGLLEKQEAEVKKALQAEGLRVRERRSLATWVTLTLRRPKPRTRRTLT